jgi:hypothetical protein
MAAVLAPTRREAFLNVELGSGTPATLHIGMHVGAFEPAHTNFAEPTGAGYARAAVTNNRTSFPLAVSTGDVTQLLSAVDLFYPEATGDWGTPRYLLIFATTTGGSPSHLLPVDAALQRPIVAGDIPRLLAGRLGIILA